MEQMPLEKELLRELRRAPSRRLEELAEAVGLPRTNFGRRLSTRLRAPLARLLDDGLIVEHRGRYRLTERGRRALAEYELGVPGSSFHP